MTSSLPSASSQHAQRDFWNWPVPVRIGMAFLMGIFAAYGVDVIGLTRIDGVDALFVFVLVTLAGLLGMALLPRVMAPTGVMSQIRSVLPYAVLQVLYVWGGIGGALVDLKLDKLAMLFGFAAFGLLILQHLWRLVQRPVLRNLLIFLAVNGVYLFFHGSSFSLGGASAGYPVVATMSGAADTAAKVIIFVLSFGVVSSALCGYGLFLWGNPKNQSQLKQFFQWVALILMGSAFVYGGLSVLGGFGKVSPGHSTLVVVLFIWLVGIGSSWRLFLVDEESKNLENITPIANEPLSFDKPTDESASASFSQHVMSFWFPKISLMTIGLMGLVMLLGMNKTSLVGLGVSLLVLEGLNWQYGRHQGLSLFRVIPEPIRVNPVWWVVIGVTFGVGLLASGMMEVIGEKITYFAEGFQSMSTLRVRTGNWFYFLQEWGDTLDFSKLFFGYGLGASRDAIFHISAMREGGHINLVQTLHNHYFETFYDYGLMALFYWFSWLGLLARFIYATMHIHLGPALRILVHMAIATMAFMLIYLMLDGLRVHVAIICFAYWGMVYGAIERHVLLNTGGVL